MTRMVKLSGFRELDRALGELPKATGKNVLRRTGKRALEPMRAAAASKAPRDQGDLQVSIVISEKRTRRVKKERGPKSGIEMAMGPSSGKGVLNYAAFVEFGTVDTAPDPYMRPAWNGGADGALEIIKRDLGDEIAKAAARLAKKRG